MSKSSTGKAVATLLIGAAIGAAVGYVLATDKEDRQEQMDQLKNKFAELKLKLKKKDKDLEQEIYNS